MQGINGVTYLPQSIDKETSKKKSFASIPCVSLLSMMPGLTIQTKYETVKTVCIRENG
jgi:hypothetical protein